MPFNKIFKQRSLKYSTCIDVLLLQSLFVKNLQDMDLNHVYNNMIPDLYFTCSIFLGRMDQSFLFIYKMQQAPYYLIQESGVYRIIKSSDNRGKRGNTLQEEGAYKRIRNFLSVKTIKYIKK